MALILVVDEAAIVREPLARVLQLSGYGVLEASGLKEALALSAGAVPDLVLLDLFMPCGDGPILLRRMRNDPRLKDVPVIVITAASGREQLLTARSLGVRDYLLKPRFSLNDLLARITRRLGAPGEAAAPLPSIAQPSSPCALPAVGTRPPGGKLDPERCLVRIRHMMSEKAPSPVTAEVIAMAAAAMVDMQKLTGVIATDPVLSSRVIQAANSAAYGPSRKAVATVPEAVRKIGFAAVRNLAVASGMMELVPSGLGFNPVRSWQHSLAVAKLSESLVSVMEPSSASLAYLAGLCHELGTILFHVLFADEYRQVTETHAQTGTTVEEVEASTFGMTRAELVDLIGRNIGLPERVTAPIEAMNRLAAPLSPVVHALRMSDAYASGMFLAPDAAARVTAFTRAHCQSAGFAEDPPLPDPDTFLNEVRSLTASLARGSEQEKAQALEPLFSRHDVRLWLARDPGMSAFDPIATALSGMAVLATHDRLPDEAESREYAGLAVICRGGAGKGFDLPAVERLVKDRPLPVLYWSASTDKSTPPPAVQTVYSRVSLERLFRFVESCGPAGAVSSAAPTPQAA